MVASSADLLAEVAFFGVAAKVSIQGYRNKVFSDVLRINLITGEPPGTI